MWRISKAALAAVLLVALTPARSFALGSSSFPVPPPPDAVAKPTVPRHPDTAPSLPGGSGPLTQPLGAVDPAESGRSYDPGPLGAPFEPPRAAWAPIVCGGAARDGRNGISFSVFEDGDMVVVLDGGSVTGHAGLFDSRYYNGASSYAVWSANVTPVSGVQREQCVKYRYYDVAYGLDVPAKRAYRFQARNFAARQLGKPYSLFATKTDTRSFYCSKLAWAAYYYTAKVDLDFDRGFYVWPVDLVLSSSTRVFGHWA